MKRTSRIICIVLCTLLLVSSFAVLSACDKNNDDADMITVTVRLVYHYPIENGSGVVFKQYKLKKGTTFNTKQFTTDTYNERGNWDGSAFVASRLFRDYQCSVAFNENDVLNENIDLYCLYYVRSEIGIIVFKTDFTTGYCAYMFDKNKPLSVQTFTISAYGEPVDESKVHFFTVEEEPKEIDISQYTYATLPVEESSYSIKVLSVRFDD